MANVKKGLGAIRRYQDEQREKAEAANKPKGEWFKWPKGVNTATFKFMQELDEDASGYDENRGVGFIAVEHQAPGPEGYKRRGLCTIDDEGQCYACERHRQNYKEGWRQRSNLYVNVAVRFDGESDFKPLIVSRNANSSFVQALVEEAVDEGTIRGFNYKVTRTGEGTSTSWLLKQLKGDPFDDSDLEVFDLDETAIRHIPYDKQAEYYGAVYSGPDEDVEPASKADDDDSW